MEYEIPFTTDEACDRFQDLDQFVQDYIEAMFWTDCSPDSEELSEKTFDDLSPEALADIIAECDDFQTAHGKQHASDLAAYEEKTGYSGGVDFWLTRNGHGAGFWDRGLGALGDRLSKVAKSHGSSDLYLGDDQKVHVS